MLFFGAVSGVNERPDGLYESYILKIAGGDKDALGALYEGVRHAVYGFALSIVQNVQDAEEILQDTFVSIYVSARGYQKMGKPMAWIFTIAKNLSLMKVRGRKRTAESAAEASDWITAESGEDRAVLEAALKRISAEESRIVMLHAVAGFKHAEIAEALELPLSTVLSKYSRAMKKLRAILKEDGEYAK